MVFANRHQAAERLATALASYKGQHPLILAIPRGAVPMGQQLARALEGELDVVLVRKLRAPFNPEFAIGSIDESGWTYVADYAESVGGTPAYLAQERQAQLDVISLSRARKTSPARRHQETTRAVHAVAPTDRPRRTHRHRGR